MILFPVERYPDYFGEDACKYCFPFCAGAYPDGTSHNNRQVIL